MTRYFPIFFIILFLFSCSPHYMVKEISTRNIPVISENGAVDSVISSIVKPYRDSIEHDMSKLVTISATPLIKNKPESKLTNLVSDILLDCGRKYCKEENLDIHPDASYVNYGGLRASLPKGDITVDHIFELMPFENEIVLLNVSGEVVKKMADRIAAREGEGIAGMKLGIKNGMVSSLLIGGKAVDLTATYWIVTNDYIANGGDQMNMFLNPAKRINTELKIRDELIKSLEERFKKEGIINVIEDGRIFHEQ